MTLTVSEIAAKLGAMIEGDGSVRISGVAGVDEAAPGDITFVTRPKYAAAAERTRASAVVVPENWTGKCPAPIIRAGDPDAAFAEIAAWLLTSEPPPEPGVHPTAIVAEGVRLGADVSIGPYCVLARDVQVGERTILHAHCCLGRATEVGRDCVFYPHVSTRERTRIGNRVIIHNGAVIGSDGFGYTQKDGKWKKIPQLGVVVIGDDVEIGANVTIDRARFGQTTIGNGVKIDNLVQVAHNVRIGDHSALAAQVGIAGSSKIGSGVQAGGQAGIGGHLTVGDRVIVGGQAGVTKDVPSGAFVSGFPAGPHDKQMKIQAHVMRLPELKQRVASLEQRIIEIERGLGKKTAGKPRNPKARRRNPKPQV